MAAPVAVVVALLGVPATSAVGQEGSGLRYDELVVRTRGSTIAGRPHELHASITLGADATAGEGGRCTVGVLRCRSGAVGRSLLRR